jgi:hypothetical protein
LAAVDVDEVNLQIVARSFCEVGAQKYEPGQNDSQQMLRL